MQMISLAKDFKTPGADLGNIMVLRDVADADKLLEKVKSAKKVRPALVQAAAYPAGCRGAQLVAGLCVQSVHCSTAH